MSKLVDDAGEFLGTPTDQAASILATGRTDVTTLFASMSARDPDGEDAEYLRWHTLDHRPEQYRLNGIRCSLRLVSTPECRSARAASDASLDATDHIMTYFFAGVERLEPFNDLGMALRDAGRMSKLLPSVQRAVYSLSDRNAAARVKVGADVLPWWPAKGVYLIIELGMESHSELTEVQGIAGFWRATAALSPYSSARDGQQITYLFLDGDPIEVAERIRPMLQKKWQASGVRPLLAAPFYATVPHDWDRYLP